MSKHCFYSFVEGFGVFDPDAQGYLVPSYPDRVPCASVSDTMGRDKAMSVFNNQGCEHVGFNGD